jgi:hypothetical protein
MTYNARLARFRAGRAGMAGGAMTGRQEQRRMLCSVGLHVTLEVSRTVVTVGGVRLARGDRYCAHCPTVMPPGTPLGQVSKPELELVRQAIEAGWFGTVVVTCAACSTTTAGVFIGRKLADRETAARLYLETRGWSCKDYTDLCPDCVRTPARTR